ncbi:bifunctional glutamate N-acetyltransferase/amino-acid acetyltransferase ArgJ [Qiania dongpingensis]|uniref:Arginine biosynthesis bifunctional protein ArgJ n=1 Tax=Qiania dongpingensis TaxID=2763669 RepID=A0A7G9G842_9FIRM|nr:bifunctional glutamate N-acetyltransferase/amino-acid acetyltransferase ArgJ [Qiania dongpingensis]QNM06974.1 bifunctional glutamate N-acetyltransferase/amino-acid acetyltransferase ArgJ [Qiania dongpingensis]
MKTVDGGVTAPKGFKAAGVHAGIKKSGKKDMALIYSEAPCRTAGVFTTNVVKAAPVKWDQKVVLESPFAQAVVVNSGVANACTGKEGYDCCTEMAAETGKALGIPKEAVLVASTGVIGAQLPMDAIRSGISKMAPILGCKRLDARLAAEAIMTTDTKPKEIAVEVELGGKTAVVSGMGKGSGMIHPNMATMLCFLTTDACIAREMLQKALSADVKDTFNMISVDGDTSTNDSVVLLANGMAGNPEITEEGEDYRLFCEALHEVMTTLSKMIAGDGEGATCLFEVKVSGAPDKEAARTLAKAVVTSSLTKAAVFGRDANWGRILCALGYSGVSFDPEKVDIWLLSRAGKLKIVENGTAAGYEEEEATRILSEEEVTAIADVGAGDFSATAWGCDLTLDYVKINADYRS